MKINHVVFNEFEPVTLSEWEAQILKDLKGKPLSSLNFKPEIDLNAKSYYHPEEFKEQLYTKSDLLDKNNNDWFITEEFVDKDSKVTNQIILKALNVGSNGLRIELGENTDFELLFQQVMMEYIYLHLIFHDIQQVKTFSDFIAGKKMGKLSIDVPFLTEGLSTGIFQHNHKDLGLVYQSLLALNAHTLCVNGAAFADFGATATQELAIIMASLNEYFQTLTNEGIAISGIENKIAIQVGTASNYVVGIAKIRALKELQAHLLTQWDLDANKSPWIQGVTTHRNMAKNDRHNNLLRQTTEAMSAVFGGVNSLVISPYSKVTNNDEILAPRMARNLQLILKEESYANQVVDPAAGAYAVEYITDQLIENAWELFMEIEQKGGIIAAIRSNYLQDLLTESKEKYTKAINEKTQTLLGVNKYPNTEVDWLRTEKEIPSKKGDFNAFNLFNLENEFEK
ncbi:hypothetical protein DNU06_05070 [Putridiphycobacter roseus]|uniref:Methylmalonyl-CoA mutase alpha/beta chain catalytic domain-containing protein n=1 Tax=Putridiphycobacter roseus TaxID=2219161 RepID=A0A2W1NQR8_9FLAO|nr:methylmalonyl-CoA mutase family protein [Putridiphycobacter roseus]PZE17992.1 hypothetical protein DNU06_05070 [Putridiphycobacter roseus]